MLFNDASAQFRPFSVLEFKKKNKSKIDTKRSRILFTWTDLNHKKKGNTQVNNIFLMIIMQTCNYYCLTRNNKFYLESDVIYDK